MATTKGPEISAPAPEGGPSAAATVRPQLRVGRESRLTSTASTGSSSGLAVANWDTSIHRSPTCPSRGAFATSWSPQGGPGRITCCPSRGG